MLMPPKDDSIIVIIIILFIFLKILSLSFNLSFNKYVIDYACWYCIYTIKKYIFSRPIYIHKTEKLNSFPQNCPGYLQSCFQRWVSFMNTHY